MIDLSTAIRAALVADATIAGLLPVWMGSRPVFTRRPAPSGAVFPMIMVSPDVALTDEDGVDDSRPLIIRDLAVYGRNSTPEDYRDVEAIAYRARDLFHRQRFAIATPGWRVIDIRASGPIPAPTDDEQIVGRVVTLTVRLVQA